MAELSTKDAVRYEQALLASGANVRRLRVDGGGLDGIHYLRTLGNSDSIRADAEQAEKVVLVGGSYIACEVAASLTGRRSQLHDGHARGRCRSRSASARPRGASSPSNCAPTGSSS